MTDTTTVAPVAVTDSDTTREAWLEARSTRVTASMIHDIATGGRATHQRILADQLNGSMFKGNKATARGNTREPFLIDYLREFVDPTIAANSLLFVHHDEQLHGATPDALGNDFGVEVKSHDHAWGDRTDVPADHYDQMQFGMWVTSMDRWLYCWEVMGEDGEPTLEDNPQHVWVKRDERRIAFLVREANRYLAWRASGAPAADDLPAELDDALARWADARARKKTAEGDEKLAEVVIRRHIESTPGADLEGLKLAGRAAAFVYSVTEKDVLDADAWAAAEPRTFAEWETAKAAIDGTADAALALYKKPSRSTRLLITPTKEDA